MYEDVDSNAMKENPECNTEKELKDFLPLISSDSETEALLKAWHSAWEQMHQSVLKDAFVKARDELMIDKYISHESEVRLPYSLDDRCYPVLLTHMVEEFRLSPFFDLMTGFGKYSAAGIVETYLSAPPTYAPKNG